MLLLAVWVKNIRLQINDKLGIIFIIKGPLGRKNMASIHPPLSPSTIRLSPLSSQVSKYLLWEQSTYTIRSNPSAVQDVESKDIVSCFTFVVKRKSEKIGSTKSSHYVHVDLMEGNK